MEVTIWSGALAVKRDPPANGSERPITGALEGESG